MSTFQELGVDSTLIKAIEELGFVNPMPVQEAVIPFLTGKTDDANEHKDLIALAQTGTGKTAAFGLPLLQSIDCSNRQTQAVVMSPTRELCLQISDDLKDFGKYIDGLHVTAVYGGAPIDSQIRSLRKGSQVIVATPGRLVDLIERGVADITKAGIIVLDEADEMLNMGFSDSINAIFNEVKGDGCLVLGDSGYTCMSQQNIPPTPTTHHPDLVLGDGDWVLVDTLAHYSKTNHHHPSPNTHHLTPKQHPRVLMFSATMSKEVEKIARQYLHNYEEIVVGSRNEGAENVDHTYYMVQAKDKYLALKRVVDYYPKIYAIIFCRTKVETQDVADKLIRDGYNAESLHGDLSQPQRDQTMQKFRQHTVQLLVATDVAARGLDVDDLTHVINYGMPDDTESYTHRSGRTGRAGKKGSSIAIIHSREQWKIRDVEKIIGKKFTKGTLPSPKEICTKQLYRVMDQITKVDVDDETIEPFMTEIQRHFEYFDKDDIIKKIVMMEFSKFLEYYADEPDIEEVQEVKGSKGSKGSNSSKRRKDSDGRDRGPEHHAEEGYTRLFINLGKAEGFYPGEVMQFINQHCSGRGKGAAGERGERSRQEVGHIDLMSHYCFIEVPEADAKNVMGALDGTNYHGRQVRCNEEGQRVGELRSGMGQRVGELRSGMGLRREKPNRERPKRRDDGKPFLKPSKKKNNQRGEFSADDWRSLMAKKDFDFRGEDPDFSEEGWARRKPKKK